MKTLLIIILSLTLLVSCKKKEVSPEQIVTFNFFAEKTPYVIKYYNENGLQIDTVKTQRKRLQYKWDEYYNNNVNMIESQGKSETDSVYIDMSYKGKFAKKSARFITKGKAYIGINYHDLR